jgi:hypothetical protein
MPKIVDLTGQVFGRLTVLHQSDPGAGGKRWVCKCACGGIAVAYSCNLQSGATKSCGCIRRRHGMGGTKLHQVWRTMLDRCNNPNANQYADYGGRGIKVCQEWCEFTQFFEDMGHPPQGGTLDRVDNNKGYDKENCKWSTRQEQARNKRNNRMITAFGKTQTVTEWAIEYSMPPRTLFNRLFRANMEPEKAIVASPYAQQRKKRLAAQQLGKL